MAYLAGIMKTGRLSQRQPQPITSIPITAFGAVWSTASHYGVMSRKKNKYGIPAHTSADTRSLLEDLHVGLGQDYLDYTKTVRRWI